MSVIRCFQTTFGIKEVVRMFEIVFLYGVHEYYICAKGIGLDKSLELFTALHMLTANFRLLF